VRTGAEVKVGVITLLAIALLALFTIYISGARFTAHTYTIYVTFDNARGIERGDPVWMVGVKIGEVRAVAITASRKAQVSLAIERQYHLYKHYLFQIASAGLIQERFIEVIPVKPEAEGPALADQATVPGVAAPDLADMLKTGQEVLTNLNRTAQQLRVVLSDQEILAGAKRALQSFTQAAEGARQAAATAASLAEKWQPETGAILSQLRAAAGNLESTTEAVRAQVEQGTTLEDLQEAARHAREMSANAERLTATLAEMVSDPQVKMELRATLSNIHEASASLKKIGEDMEAFSGKLREAAPAVPKVVKEAQQMAGVTEQIRESLKPPEIHGNFKVLYSGKEGRSFSTGSLDFSTSPDRFLRLGIDDIGEESSVSIQLAEQQRLGVLRYGLVRSRLGLGFDLGRAHRATLSVDLFDPNRLRADVMADVPLILGATDWGMTVGVRNAGGENLFVVGARAKR
jgi:phospholipid/cholesterol/gamma-HCH transport system substrate-binding protein